MKKKFLAAALSLGLVGTTVPSPVQANDEGREGKGFKHVLLISIDGMHAVDLLNCSEGLTDINGGVLLPKPGQTARDGHQLSGNLDLEALGFFSGIDSHRQRRFAASRRRLLRCCV